MEGREIFKYSAMFILAAAIFALGLCAFFKRFLPRWRSIDLERHDHELNDLERGLDNQITNERSERSRNKLAKTVMKEARNTDRDHPPWARRISFEFALRIVDRAIALANPTTAADHQDEENIDGHAIGDAGGNATDPHGEAEPTTEPTAEPTAEPTDEVKIQYFLRYYEDGAGLSGIFNREMNISPAARQKLARWRWCREAFKPWSEHQPVVTTGGYVTFLLVLGGIITYGVDLGGKI